MTDETPQSEIAELRRRLEEAEETIRAVKTGAVDAFVVEEPSGTHNVYTLKTADRPYRVLVEQMQQGAATLQVDGTISYCNLRLADLLRVPHERLIGAPLHDFIAKEDRSLYDGLLWQGRTRSGRGEMRLCRRDGAIVPAYFTFNSLPEDAGAAIGVLVTDLTDQRHHEQLSVAHAALRVSEEQFRTLVAQVRDYAIFRTSLDRCASTWNEGVRRVLGFEQEEFIGIDVLPAIFGPEDVASGAAERELTLAMAQGSVPIDRWVLRKDGSRFYAIGMTTALRNERGKIVGFTIVLRDQTPQRRAEEALRERTEQFETLINRAPLGVFLVGPDLRIRQVNPIAAPAFGDIPGGILDRDLGEILHMMWKESFADELVRIFRHTLETGESYVTPERAEVRIDRGVVEYNEWHFDRIVLPEGSHGVVCYFRDISAQVKARLSIAVSEERYRSLVSISTDVPWTADPEGRFIAEQPAWSSYTGQTLAELRDFGWCMAIHPDDRSAVLESWKRACREVVPYESRGRLWHQLSRQWRRFAARAMPLRDADGTLREWVGACTDVEDREALLASERMARAEADRAVRMKDDFLAVLSHELRSPLNAIVGYAHLLRRWATDPELVLKAVEVVERNTRVQAQLIDDLLDTSRIAAGKMRLRAEPVDLSSVLSEAIDSIRPAAEAKGITMGTSGDATGAQLHGDPARLQQIVGNLLSNAVKFTPPGGAVGVQVATDDTHVEIRVTDTGEGIDPEFLPHLFGRFRQADSSATRTHGGLGLGLALVKQLTELHGGTVEARSAGKGQGSMFTVSLPLDLAERTESGDETKPLVSEPVDLSGLSVLVVDDEPDALEVLRRILEECGAEVISATGADEALAQLVHHRVHVILSDIGMPVSDGYEFISTVRKQGMQTPAAAVTAFVRAEDRKRVLQAGYQAHVSKPIQPAHLLNTVASLGGKLANA